MDIVSNENEAFVKDIRYDYHFDDYLKNQELIEKLEGMELIPPVMLLTANPETSAYRVVMEKVEGFSLDNMPTEMDGQKYSLEFAKELAQLFVRLKDAGAYHGDIHMGNIMQDTANGRLVFIDLEELTDDPHPIGDYVRDYDRALIDIYLGVDIFSTTDELLKERDSDNEALRAFYKEYAGYELQGVIDKDPKVLHKLVMLFGLSEKINPQIVDFLAKGVTPDTREITELNFDELFSLK